MSPEKQIITLAPYDKTFLDLSWDWLTDPEIKELTMTPDFSQKDQAQFFAGLEHLDDYHIWGLLLNGAKKIGACGLKNHHENRAEYWGYIGEKELWGKGLGTQVLSLVHAQARKLGLQTLYLNVAKNNSRAISLYRKFGYGLKSEQDASCIMEVSISDGY